MEHGQQPAFSLGQVTQFGYAICLEPGCIALDSLGVANVPHAANSSLESLLIRSSWAKFQTSQAPQRGPAAGLIQIAQRVAGRARNGLEVDRAHFAGHSERVAHTSSLT